MTYRRRRARLTATFSRLGVAAAQMRGLGNVSRQVARDYSSEWRRATDARINDSRRMYTRLERMEANYLRQVERRVAAERRAERSAGRGAGGRLGSGSVGRIPAPRLSTIALGGGIVSAGVAGVLKKRMEAQAAEVRAQMFGELSSIEVEALRKSFADRAGINRALTTPQNGFAISAWIRA